MTEIEYSQPSPALPVGAGAPARDCGENLWFFEQLLTGKDPDLWPWAIDEAERVLRTVPPSFTRDDELALIAPARAGDADACQQLAASLNGVRLLLERARDAAPEPEPKKPRTKRGEVIRKRSGLTCRCGSTWPRGSLSPTAA